MHYTMAIILAAVTLTTVDLTPAHAGYGAIAYDQNNGKEGASWNQKTPAEANEPALKQCAWAEGGSLGRPGNPGGVVGGRLVGVVAAEIDRVVPGKRRDADGPHRHQGLGERGVDPVQVVASVRPANQIPATAFDLTVADIDN